MSAESETFICNLALTRLGHTQIVDIETDTKKAGDLCRLYYRHCRDSLLRAHPWNFSIKRASLSRETATPNHEYTYSFALPVDCLKVIRTSWEALGYSSDETIGVPGGFGHSIPYRLESKKLLTNEATCSIEYIARVTDTSLFDEMFTDLLAQRLAAEMAMALTDNPRVVGNAWEVYRMKLPDARTTDAQEGSTRDVVDTSAWALARI